MKAATGIVVLLIILGVLTCGGCVEAPTAEVAEQPSQHMRIFQDGSMLVFADVVDWEMNQPGNMCRIRWETQKGRVGKMITSNGADIAMLIEDIEPASYADDEDTGSLFDPSTAHWVVPVDEDAVYQTAHAGVIQEWEFKDGAWVLRITAKAEREDITKPVFDGTGRIINEGAAVPIEENQP